MTDINSSDLEKIIQAILKAQNNLQWKPQKAEPHLKKRIRLGHLPENSTPPNNPDTYLSNRGFIYLEILENLKPNHE